MPRRDRRAASRDKSVEIKRRPKDRKAQIARASADAFSSMGYHAVGMEHIAAAVGISAAALYRHYPSKYELFRAAVTSLGQQLVDCTAFADEASDGDDPAEQLDRLVAALIDTAIANRSSGGLYRWEGRYLRGDDQAELMTQMKVVNRRLQAPLNDLRPSLSSRDRWTLSAATLSVIGSIADHRSQLPIPEIRSVLGSLATATLQAELPAGTPGPVAARVAQAPPAAGRYEAVLRASMTLFNRNGYRETSMEDIAAEVGMPASGIYRYFGGKADILAASFRRAADRVSGDLADVIAAQQDPETTLLNLIDSYVARSFDDPELAYVYYTERANLPPGDERMLRSIQRATVEAWVRILVAVCPELTDGRARFVVHAGFALVVDLGRLVQYENTEESRAYVRRMMEVTLLGLRAPVLPTP
jgi:AcrR family transcriptional regulator